VSERPEAARAERATLTQRTVIGDPATVDLRGKVDGAWSDFRTALEAALPAMPVGSRLTVTLDPTATGTGEAVYDVVLRVLPQSTVHADAVGNAGLPEEYRLDRVAVGDLVALGWSPPGVVEETADRFGLRVPMDEAPGVASVVTRTLRDVYGAPHPAFLTYTVSGDDVLPALGSARPVAAGTVLAAHTPFVKINDNPRLVDVYSPILTEVEPDERLYERLSQLTQRMPIGRLYCTESTVWASVPVFGRDFQPTHLLLALQVMTRLADELDDRLQGDFGGKRFFGEGDKGVSRAERTGMYL
jgi:hypothetical protein